ncbi:MAG: TonB-dependent receptor [Bacteroidota bacterium]
MRRIWFIIILVFTVFPVFAQQGTLKGTVSELQDNKKAIPLVGANLFWKGTTTGTSADKDGNFSIKKITTADAYLVVSYIGYKNDTLLIPASLKEINIVLKVNKTLGVVVVEGKNDGSYISKMKPIYTQVISSSGLQKAACCNLAESFQNSATVDVNYSDAVTGARQIQMLGLSGVYSQSMIENVPAIRGLATSYGLGYVPGPWMESIQISKGTSSVINGYESITGQINVEYKKPEETEEPFYLNLYGNSFGRGEGNFYTKTAVSKNVSTMLSGHAEQQFMKIDDNGDSFMDIPLVKQYNVMNRWDVDIPGKLEAKYLFSALQEERNGGQMDFVESADRGDTNRYGFGIKTDRYQTIIKNGIMFPQKPGQSIGTILSATHHAMDGFFGLNKYKAAENTFYANMIFASYFGKTNHKYSTGLSYLLNDLDENLNDSTFNRIESVPGAFFQYTYDYLDVFTLIAGARADYHSIYGTFLTPRIHGRYMLNEKTTFRGSAGRGYRIPYPVADNLSLLVSSRKFILNTDVKAESAWNYGVSVHRTFKVRKEEASLSLDFYRTDFENQLIVDLDSNRHRVYFYNLNGKSYSNAAQAELNIKPLKNLDITTAARWVEVKVTEGGDLIDKPMVSKYKGLVAASYSLFKKKLKIDATIQFIGKSRLPVVPESFSLSPTVGESPAYNLVFGQITYKIGSFDIYVGGENLNNYIQKNPVMAAEAPFGKHFDASMVWGPVTGRMFYAGLRLTLNPKEKPAEVPDGHGADDGHGH